MRKLRKLTPTCDVSGRRADVRALGPQLVQAVREHGYGLARTDGLSDRKLLSIARRFGEIYDASYPIVHIRYEPDSLSRAFDRKSVPPHCECAYHAELPRYLFLYCEAPSHAGGTFYLVSMKEVLERLGAAASRALRTTPYGMVSPATGLPATRPLVAALDGVGDVLVLGGSQRDARPLYSYPAGRPAELLLRRVARVAADRALHLHHRWRRGDIVVFDNARFLHGRDAFAGVRRHLKHLRAGRFTAQAL